MNPAPNTQLNLTATNKRSSEVLKMARISGRPWDAPYGNDKPNKYFIS